MIGRCVLLDLLLKTCVSNPTLGFGQVTKRLFLLPGALVLIGAFALTRGGPLAGEQITLSSPTSSRAGSVSPHPESSATPAFTILDAIILGIVEGVTEFLPISSTGHLILAESALGLRERTAIEGVQTPPEERNRREGGAHDITADRHSRAIDAYLIIIQSGAIAAVAILYWSSLCLILKGIFGKSREGLLLGRNLILAFLPAAVLGPVVVEFIEARFFNLPSVTAAIFAGAVLMLLVERRRKTQSGRAASTPVGETGVLHQMTASQSLLIGLCQCVAMWPGTSRSMMAIVGGYLVGLDRKSAAEFSFLLGLITLSAAALYKVVKTGPEVITSFGWTPVLTGCVVAAGSAAIAVKWMVGYLARHGLALFAWYRILLALTLLALFPLSR